MAAQPTGEGPITAINVTPLVDVVLVLLIILMVTAGYIVSKTIPVDLPKGSTAETTNLTLAITIDAKGQRFLDAAAVDQATLRSRVRQAHDRDAETRAVIAADGSTSHRDVVGVIDLLRQEGVTRFAINVQPDDVKSQ
ncbi:MAG TPA: biopolymer transporter ExbD [Polyangiaceae bacterium]